MNDKPQGKTRPFCEPRNPGDSKVMEKLRPGGVYSRAFDVPGWSAEDAAHLKALQADGRFWKWADNSGAGPAGFLSPNNPLGAEFVWRNDDGPLWRQNEKERKLADWFMTATDEMKARRKQIDQIDRAIRLVNTADHAARTMTLVAHRLAGKAHTKEHPLNDDYKRLHESIIETLTSQKKYLEMLNTEQNVPGSSPMNATAGPPPEPLAMTFTEELEQFVHSCLFEIRDLKDKNRDLEAKINHLEKLSFEKSQRHVRELREQMQRAERVNDESGQYFMENRNLREENSSLKKTIAGLRSAITRMGGKTHPPRKRKK